MSDKILIIDDAPRVVRLVSEVLRAVGYEVVAAGTGESALKMAALEQPDLVLLDILLPQGMDGYEVCRRLREFSDVPVIMLTAKARDQDVLDGFDVGADDYLTKPFNAKELVARVKAILRRSQTHERPADTELTCGDLTIDFAWRPCYDNRADQIVRTTRLSTRRCEDDRAPGNGGRTHRRGSGRPRLAAASRRQPGGRGAEYGAQLLRA